MLTTRAAAAVLGEAQGIGFEEARRVLGEIRDVLPAVDGCSRLALRPPGPWAAHFADKRLVSGPGPAWFVREPPGRRWRGPSPRIGSPVVTVDLAARHA